MVILNWVRTAGWGGGLLLLAVHFALAALQSTLLTWTRQPSHVHMCLRFPYVSAHWSSWAVTKALHNSPRREVWVFAADTREAARGDLVFQWKIMLAPRGVRRKTSEFSGAFRAHRKC